MAGVEQIGSYYPAEIEWLIEHDNTVLLEVESVGWDFDAGMEPGGAGLGRLQNSYHKRTKAPSGSWSIDRKMLSRTDKGQLFLDLLKGSAYILTEYVAAAASTHTPAETLVSILHVRTRTGGVDWVEGVDYTVAWSTGVITFVSTVPAGGLEVKYLTTTAALTADNLVTNGGFEDAITNTWEAEATGTPSRDDANEYVGDYGLKVLAPAQNDGVKHVPDIVVVPGRVYHCRAWVKGTDTETFKAQWTDSGGTSDMTGSMTLSGADWNEFNWTFTPDEETILDIRIINTTAAPNTFYVDEVYLGENAPTVNPLDGQQHAFTFNILARRVVDAVQVMKMKQCAIYADSGKSGAPYTESISGQFLDYEGESS